jgi:hypothetical protein
VPKGFTQKHGIDFNETFAPVARLGSIRLFMAIAVELGLQVHQLDFTSAYLNDEIDEELFMEVPSEFNDILNEEQLRKFKGNKVCLVGKSLYCLKQSDRQWYKKLYTIYRVSQKWRTNGALRCRRDYRKRQKNVKKNSIGLTY